jgi:hypothetical protein
MDLGSSERRKRIEQWPAETNSCVQEKKEGNTGNASAQFRGWLLHFTEVADEVAWL